MYNINKFYVSILDKHVNTQIDGFFTRLQMKVRNEG